MNQPDIQARKEYVDIVENSVSVVPIAGTRRSVRLRWMHPYTMERITKVWIERDLAAKEVENGAAVLKDLCEEPYFTFKEAALMILNHDLKIRFFYPIYWRWLSMRYTEPQMLPIIEEGKKKLPLEAHYMSMVFSKDMNAAMRKMTKAEAVQYQAELLSAVKQHSSRTSPLTGFLGGASSVGSATSATAAY